MEIKITGDMDALKELLEAIDVADEELAFMEYVYEQADEAWKIHKDEVMDDITNWKKVSIEDFIHYGFVSGYGVRIVDEDNSDGEEE